MKLDYPIMVAALGVAAAVQEVLPAIPVGEPALKAQFVPAVALYYLRHRQWPLSLTAAMWAGVLLDALGSLPFGTSSFALLFIGIVTIIFRRHVVNSSPVSALVPGMALSLALGAVQIFGYNLSGDVFCRISFFAAFWSFIKLLPVAAVLAAVADAILARVDRDAGNIELSHEGVES